MDSNCDIAVLMESIGVSRFEVELTSYGDIDVSYYMQTPERHPNHPYSIREFVSGSPTRVAMEAIEARLRSLLPPTAIRAKRTYGWDVFYILLILFGATMTGAALLGSKNFGTITGIIVITIAVIFDRQVQRR